MDSRPSFSPVPVIRHPLPYPVFVSVSRTSVHARSSSLPDTWNTHTYLRTPPMFVLHIFTLRDHCEPLGLRDIAMTLQLSLARSTMPCDTKHCFFSPASQFR